MRVSLVAVVALLLSACRTGYLPSTTLTTAAPRCGSHAIGPSEVGGDATYFACQVDVRARSPDDRPLDYPELLARANVEGTVELQFVVDGRGAVDSTTIVVLRSAHQLFTRAARQAILTWRATPALRRGAAVRQLTTHAFCFRLAGDDTIGGCEESVVRYPESDVSLACEDATRSIVADRSTREVVPQRRQQSRCKRPPDPAIVEQPRVAARPLSVSALTNAPAMPALRWTSVQRDSAMAILSHHRARWIMARPRKYRYWEVTTCFCFHAGISPRVVTVSDGRVTGATDSTGQRTDAAFLRAGSRRWAGIDALFDRLAAGIRDSAYAEVRVEYDTVRDYPLRAAFDRDMSTSDDELHIAVSHFEIVR